MPKGYKTLSISDDSYKRAMSFYKILNPDISFSKWISDNISTMDFTKIEITNLKAKLDRLEKKPNKISSLRSIGDMKRSVFFESHKKLCNSDGYAFENDVVNDMMKSKIFSTMQYARALINTLRMEGKVTEKNNMIKVDYI